MNINNNGTDCCASAVINDLAAHPDPLSAMKAFCRHYKAPKYLGGGTTGVRTFYIFSGVEKLTKGSYPDVVYGYPAKFARFIVKNGLGNVVKSVLRSNHLYHPDHLDRVYVWHPNVVALSKWWKENGD
jgi:hypothetical protein